MKYRRKKNSGDEEGIEQMMEREGRDQCEMIIDTLYVLSRIANVILRDACSHANTQATLIFLCET